MGVRTIPSAGGESGRLGFVLGTETSFYSRTKVSLIMSKVRRVIIVVQESIFYISDLISCSVLLRNGYHLQARYPITDHAINQ